MYDISISRTNVKITCCKDCKNRKSGCHSTCVEYWMQSKKLEDEKKKAFDRLETESNMYLYLQQAKKNMAKGNR